MANNNREAVVKNAMSRAAKLMQLESNGTLDKIASAHKDGINASLEGGDVLTEELMTTARDRKTQAPIVTREMGANASNVPAAIREAFMNNPIDDAQLYSAFGEQGDGRSLSFLDEMSAPKQQITAPTQDVRQIVNEGMGYTTQSQPQVTQQIDYPMIRTIVEEIVRKYAVSLKKNILAENKQATPTNQINTIALGETFKFLDNEGNIYEAKLVKKGNIKKKSVNG